MTERHGRAVRDYSTYLSKKRLECKGNDAYEAKDVVVSACSVWGKVVQGVVTYESLPGRRRARRRLASAVR